MAPSATLLMVSWLTVMARQISRCLMAEAFSLGMHFPATWPNLGGRFLVGNEYSIFTWRAGSYIMLSNVVTRTGVDDDGQEN